MLEKSEYVSTHVFQERGVTLLQLRRLSLLVLMQGRWSTDVLAVGQPLWNSAELMRHLLTL